MLELSTGDLPDILSISVMSWSQFFSTLFDNGRFLELLNVYAKA